MKRVLGCVCCLCIGPGRREASTRSLVGTGNVFRWVAITVVAMNAIMHPPPLPLLLVFWMAAVGLYTGLSTLSGRLASANTVQAVWGLTLADLAGLLSLLALYGGCPPPDGLNGLMGLVLVEAMVAGGGRGVLVIAGIIVLAMPPLYVLHADLRGEAVQWMDLATRALFLVMMAAGLALARAVLSAASGRDTDGGLATAQNGSRTEAAAASRTAAGPPPIHLTSREREVVSLMAKGYTNRMIARRLQVTERTVKGHVELILLRLGARNRAEAVAVASRLKLVE